MTKRQNAVVIAVFLAMIFGGTAASLFLKNGSFSEKENRVLAQMPKISLEKIFDGSFSREYETYLADQFFARDGWIGMKTRTERLAGKREINDVYFAKDGYLIEKHSGVFDTDMAENSLRYLAGFLETCQAVYGQERVRAILVPNAVMMLRDKLPAFAPGGEEEAYLARAAKLLPEGSLLDAAAVLEEQNEDELYYHTDHHWTTKAARCVYEAWAREIQLDTVPLSEYTETVLTEDFHGTIDAKVNVTLPGDRITAYEPKEAVPYTLTYNHGEQRDSLYDRSCLETRDKYGVFFGGNQPLIEAETQAGTGRRLLVIKDSYANCFLPFAMQDFDRVDLIDLRYFNENLGDYMGKNRYTDILVLYNAAGFAEDPSLAKLALVDADKLETEAGKADDAGENGIQIGVR